MLLASLIAGLATAPAAALPALPAAPAAVRPAPQDPQEEFLEKWAEAMRFDDQKALEAALARYKETAILEFITRATNRATAGSDELDVWVDTFISTWSSLYKSDFARNYDRYQQMLSGTQRESRDTLVGQDFPRLNSMHLKALVEKDSAVDWGVLRDNADAVAAAMARTGDLYYMAFAYNIQGNVWNPEFHEEGADGMKAVAAYEACLKAREDLGLTNDQFYGNCAAVLHSLRAKLGLPGEDGEPIEEEAPKARPGEMLPVEEVPPATAPLVPTAVEKPGSVVHSTDMDGENRFGWKRIGAGKVGETVTFPAIQPAVRLERIGDNRWRLEAGGEPSEEFRLSSRPVEVEVERVHPDGSKAPYTLLLAAGSTSDSFQGVSLNLQPSEGGGAVFYRSIATMTADTPFGELVLWDMNADGSFGHEELKLDWSEGLLPDTFFYRPDAMTLGRMKHSRPYAPWIQDDKGQWYSVEVDDPGPLPSAVTLQPVTVETGTLELSFEGIRKLKPASILLKSDNSATEGLLLDLATMKGDEYTVPVGRWIFLQARFAGKSGEEFLVLPPESVPIQVDVDATEPAQLVFGEPFRLVTKAVADGESVTVDGRSLHVRGVLGERYLRVMGEPMYGIEASLKSESEELRAPFSEEANEDWERLYYPMDAVLEVQGDVSGETVELELKKHPWFGKLSGEVEL